MNEQRRSLLAAGLSLLVLIGWFYFFGDKIVPPPPAQVPAAVATVVPQSAQGSQEAALPDTKVLRETPLVGIEWSSRVGAPSSVLLKRYRETVDKKSPPRNLIPFDGEKALEVLCDGCNQTLPDQFRLAKRATGPSTLNGISFEGEKGGVVLRKEYEWKEDQYLFNLKLTFENRGEKEFRGRVGLGWQAKQFPEPPKGMFGFLRRPGNQRTLLYQTGTDVKHLHKQEKQELRGVIPWAGIEDRYFLIALISRRISSDQGVSLDVQGGQLNLGLYPGEVSIPPGGRHEELFSFYLGPKERESLQVAGVSLEKAIDYGWFSILAIPILKTLQIFHSFLKNWGLAVILLTLVIKLLMNPLTLKSMKQMKEMQTLQPKLAELKERYKDDRQRLNMEMMQLFKTHKVNPMGGCFPMLLQMPIYIVLYKVLWNAIELYHAPFVGFYRDLSAPDPYFILPILLGISMVAQQKLTPSASADPMQKQMMMLMPIMFTSFMLFLPVGLVLYIFINTLFSVIQQVMYQRGIRLRDLVKLGRRPTTS